MEKYFTARLKLFVSADLYLLPKATNERIPMSQRGVEVGVSKRIENSEQRNIRKTDERWTSFCHKRCRWLARTRFMDLAKIRLFMGWLLLSLTFAKALSFWGTLWCAEAMLW